MRHNLLSNEQVARKKSEKTNLASICAGEPNKLVKSKAKDWANRLWPTDRHSPRARDKKIVLKAARRQLHKQKQCPQPLSKPPENQPIPQPPTFEFAQQSAHHQQ